MIRKMFITALFFSCLVVLVNSCSVEPDKSATVNVEFDVRN